MTSDFPDVSYYQGMINWETMRTKTTNVIIRGLFGTSRDIRFQDNWNGAKAQGILRGIYAFYHDPETPKAQADALVALIRNDLPETRVWIDWERTYNGQYAGLNSVVAMMKEVERQLPTVVVGVYTGYYWFKEHTNITANRAEFEYLKTHPLWIADYDSAPMIPLPWVWPPELHQYGTPVVGIEYGTQSKELDMNRILDNFEVYSQTPPTQGENNMLGKVLVNLNIRRTPDSTQAPVGQLQPNDIVEAATEVNGWWQLTKIMRAGSAVALPLTTCYAYEGASNGYIQEITAPPVPVGGPPKKVTVELQDGSVWVATTFTEVI